MEAPTFRAPRFIAPDDLEAAARRFLERYHPALTTPVPVETIAEFGLGLEIRPVDGLYRAFEVDGFLSFDAQVIFVDQWQMERQETRYRFTIAHEIGHWALHRDVYKDAGVVDIPSYLAAYAAMSEDDIGRWEFQARNFAGRILLPRAPFVCALQECYGAVRAKLPRNTTTQLTCKALARALAARFNVHEDVVEIRLVRDGLCEEIGLAKPARSF